MNRNPLLDNDFLKELYLHRQREIFAKLVALTLDENPIEEIQGSVTGGSISLDGTSNVRRTCNLSLVAKEMNINQYYWGLKNKFKLYIGLANDINKEYEDIIWFPMGIYIIANFATSQSTNNYTISITGKDKMCLLNGELSGSLFASIDFGKEEIYYKDKTTEIRYIPIKDIIREAVHAYAGEKVENIIVNDLEDYGIELLDYKNSQQPMYMYYHDDGASNKICDQYTLNEKEIVFIHSFNSNNEDVWEEVQLKNIPVYYNRIELDFSGIEAQNPTVVYKSRNYDITNGYVIAKIEYGQTCGYRLTDITYPGELVSGIGESITSILDKIVNMLGNFEYFFDVDGRFIFQKKLTFVDKSWNNIVSANQTSYVSTVDETYVESSAYVSPTTWTFGAGMLVSTYSNTPVLSNVRNDFSIWGTKKSITGSELPVHLRYAVDKKPQYYKTLPEKRRDYLYRGGKVFITKEYFDELYGGNPELLRKTKHNYVQDIITGYCYEDNPDDPITLIDGHSVNQFEVEEYNIILCDWREIIFQMALDDRQHGHEDGFYLNVRKQNGLNENSEWRFPTGKTGYEQYYIDMEGFWRQLYCPPQLLNSLYPSGVWTDRDTGNNYSYSTNEINKESAAGIYFSTSTGIVYFLSGVEGGTFIGDLPANWFSSPNSNDGWAVGIIDSPETTNFWIDFLDADENADLTKYSVPVIGDRAKSVNDNMVKAIYFREVPNVLFTEDLETIERKSGYSYLQYNSGLKDTFNISSQGKNAMNVAEEFLNNYLYCTETISMNTVPIYHLQPNTRVLVYDNDSKINGEYLVSRISIPLNYNGMMTVSATKSASVVY